MAEISTESFEDGKYELCQDSTTLELYAKRYGERWQEFGHSKFMYSVLYTTQELRAKERAYEKLLSAIGASTLDEALAKLKRIKITH